MSEHLRGPWSLVISTGGTVITDLEDLDDGEDVDFCICRGGAIPVDGEWPDTYSGNDVIELWDDVEPDEAEIRLEQAKAMVAGLNAAGGAS